MGSYLSQEYKKITKNKLQEMKSHKEKIAMLTCYDYTSALIMDRAGVDAILVGDSASNVMLGEDTTLSITLEQMIYHTRCVRNAVKRAFLVADMPFGSIYSDRNISVANAIKMMKESGADAIKIEGGEEVADTIQEIIKIGIPVVGHLGLTPQSVHQLGGYGLQAKSDEDAKRLRRDIKRLEEVGCCMIVLEKIPAVLASEVTQNCLVPTIGIGAGSGTDGQVLVMQDMLGMNQGFKPKFLRQFAQLSEEMMRAFQSYSSAVKSLDFPSDAESY